MNMSNSSELEVREKYRNTQFSDELGAENAGGQSKQKEGYEQEAGQRQDITNHGWRSLVAKFMRINKTITATAAASVVATTDHITAKAADAATNNTAKLNPWDLSTDEDLSVAIMNLVSIEEHLFFSGAKTGNGVYYALITEVRTIRKELLGKLITEYDGEEWCIAKHLLAASYRLMEVGTKLLDQGKQEEAHSFFDKAYSLYSLFWGIKLKKIDTQGVQKIYDTALNTHDEKRNGILGKLKDIVRKVVDCCIE